jgi:diacylglycerol kinase family enzyme
MNVLADIAQIREEDTIIAAVGGDGTQHAVCNGIMRFCRERPSAPIPAYVPIPMGTGNNIAKSLFLASCLKGKNNLLKRSINAIANGLDHRIDLGVVRSDVQSEKVYFLDAFSVGFDPAVLAGKDASTARLAATRPWALSLLKGYPLYAWHGISALFSFKPVEAKVEIDGEPWYSGSLFNMVVNDTAIYGGVFNLTESTYPDDGMLDAVIFTTPADYLRKYLMSFRCNPSTLRTFFSTSAGGSLQKSGKTFKITLNEEMPSQIDGEAQPPDRFFELTTIPSVFKTRNLTPRSTNASHF